jgi:hypothetical protein
MCKSKLSFPRGCLKSSNVFLQFSHWPLGVRAVSQFDSCIARIFSLYVLKCVTFCDRTYGSIRLYFILSTWREHSLFWVLCERYYCQTKLHDRFTARCFRDAKYLLTRSFSFHHSLSILHYFMLLYQSSDKKFDPETFQHLQENFHFLFLICLFWLIFIRLSISSYWAVIGIFLNYTLWQ